LYARVLTYKRIPKTRVNMKVLHENELLMDYVQIIRVRARLII
jgi:hypothetical protein